MFNIRIADVVIGIDNKYDYIRNMCHDYISTSPATFTVSVNDEEIERENPDGFPYPSGYLETLAIYRKIADKIADSDGYLMHGVLMDVEGHGILLCAESGTGKSTHAALWQKLLGEKCRIINGDKPLIRLLDNLPYGYGTPWCGKEEINENARVRLFDVCFIRRAEENSVRELAKSEVLLRLIPAIHFPDGDGAAKVFDILDVAARNLRFFEISCNMDISAAKTAYDAIMAVGK